MSTSNNVDLHITARGVIAAERRTDRAHLPAEAAAALDAAVRLAQQVLDGDNAVLVRGGVVANDPVLPVIDLDFLNDDCHITPAVRALETATALGWASVADEVRAYLQRYANFDPETEQWTRRGWATEESEKGNVHGDV